MDRVHLINPGQSVTVGDRRLTAVKPPVYDNPITTGFVDDRTGILFSSDCFGALAPRLRAIEPTMVCSSHLPPAPGAMLDVLVDSLAQAPAAERFVGPDQATLQAMLAGMVDVPA